MTQVKHASIIIKPMDSLTKSESKFGIAGNKFGIGSSLIEVSPLGHMQGPGVGCVGCQSACYSCDSYLCSSGCGASNILKVK